MNAALQDARQTPPLLGGLLAFIVLLLLVSIGLQAGVVNPTAQTTQSEVRKIACAIAEQQAVASRVRTDDPATGHLESREHFLTRMLAQRHTLLLASGVGCDSAPGFPPFDVQVARALREINEILGYRKSKPPASGPQLQANPKSVQNLDHGSAGGGAGATSPLGGSVGAGDPGADGGQDQATTQPGAEPTTPEPTGDDFEPAPQPAPAVTTPTPVVPAEPAAPSGGTEATPAAAPDPVQSTLEGVSNAITPTVCAVAEVLRHNCPE